MYLLAYWLTYWFVTSQNSLRMTKLPFYLKHSLNSNLVEILPSVTFIQLSYVDKEIGKIDFRKIIILFVMKFFLKQFNGLFSRVQTGSSDF